MREGHQWYGHDEAQNGGQYEPYPPGAYPYGADWSYA